MNLGTAKRQALILMREWTLDGAAIPVMENSDYLKSADDYANLAQMDIARRKKIPAFVTVVNPSAEEYGAYYLHIMPSDFMELDNLRQMTAEGLISPPDGVFTWLDTFTLAILKTSLKEFRVSYYRVPTQIVPDLKDLTKNDDYEFEIAPEVQYLIPFFMAAQMLMDEDRGMAQVKLNEYMNRLMELTTRSVNQQGRVENVLGW